MKSKKEEKRIQATYDYKGRHEISEIPKDLKSLKEKIKELYHLNDEQLNKCQISYIDRDQNKSLFIMDEQDFQKAKIISEEIVFTIEDIVEQNKDFIIKEDKIVYINPNNNYYKNKYNDKIQHEKINNKNDFINMLNKPKMNVDNLDYIEDSYGIYVNLFEIKLKKDIIIYQYPFTLVPEAESGDIIIIKKIFKSCQKELKSIFGEYFIMGNSLYGFNEVEAIKTVKTILRGKKGRIEFKLEFQKYLNSRTIKQDDIQNDDPVCKLYIELLIKDILSANKKLDYYKRLFIKIDEKKIIESEQNNLSVTFYPGFATSFVETQTGKFLNVSLKNKIIQKETILDYLNEKGYKNPANREKIKESLLDQVFKPSYDNKNYCIDDICFDRNPMNQSFNLQGEGTITLFDYYKKIKGITIKEKDQPLLVVKKTDKEKNPINLYFIPSLCHFTGINDKLSKDYKFMKKLADYTKLTPRDRVMRTNQFINLLTDSEKREGELSPKEKSEKYGIEVKPLNDSFKAYQMKATQLIAGNNKILNNKDKVFPLLKKIEMKNWICLYEKNNYDDADYLYQTLQKSSKGYGLIIEEPEWVEMDNHSKYKE